MEISDLTFAGIPIWAWLLIIGFLIGLKKAIEEWRDRREMIKELDDHKKGFDKEYVWKAEIENGVDQGYWVRRDDGTRAYF